MKVTSFCDQPDNATTYLLENENECLVIDPANNVSILSKYIGDKKLLGIFITHGHYDHFKELENLRKKYPVTIYLNKKAKEKLENKELSCATLFLSNLEIYLNDEVCYFVRDSEIIKLGKFLIQVLFLPGHTNCSVGYLIERNLFSGDVLFSNSVGRYDLPTGSYPATLESMRRIKKMNPLITVYSGHDESFTIEEALEINKYLW